MLQLSFIDMKFKPFPICLLLKKGKRCILFCF